MKKISMNSTYILAWLFILVIPALVTAADTTTPCANPYTFTSTTPGYNGNNDLIFSAITFTHDTAPTATTISNFENRYKLNLPHTKCTNNPMGFSYTMRWNDADQAAMFGGAYLYVISPLTNISMKVTSHSSAYRQSSSDAAMIIYNLSNFDSSSNLNRYLNVTNRLTHINKVILQRYAWDDYSTNSGTGCPAPADGLSSCQQTYFSTNIPPGLYYVASGVALDVDGNPLGTDTMSSYLELKFYTKDATGKNIETGVLSNRLLSPKELNDKFGDRVEKEKWLCDLAGGSFDTTRGCCGDDIGSSTCTLKPDWYSFFNDDCASYTIPAIGCSPSAPLSYCENAEVSCTFDASSGDRICDYVCALSTSYSPSCVAGSCDTRFCDSTSSTSDVGDVVSGKTCNDCVNNVPRLSSSDFAFAWTDFSSCSLANNLCEGSCSSIIPPAATGTCSGTIRQCESYSSETSCEAALSCRWDYVSSLCLTVDTYECRDISNPAICATNYCTWDDTPAVDPCASKTDTATCRINTTCKWTPKQATETICDNKDDNCNGLTDEGLTCACTDGAIKSETCGIDACRNTVAQTCTGGIWSPACIPKPSSIPEICGNNIDENCNGMADDVCPSICGNDMCQSGETPQTCFIDCDINYGWNTSDATWNLSSQGYLNNSGIGKIYSDYLDIKANTNYTLSAIIDNFGRNINISLDGTCLNSSMLQGDCFTPKSTEAILVSNNGLSTVSVTINIPNNTNSINNIYFRNVRILITSTDTSTATGSYALIHNISLKESTTLQYIGSLLETPTIGGCCPISFCWDGTSCRDSKDFMSSSQTMPFLGTELVDLSESGHVSYSNRTKTVGYRCIVVNTSTNESQWVLSEIKYDWDHNESGYCAKSTDCFVDAAYHHSNETYSVGCVHDGDVISDASDGWMLHRGNHYCHQGAWTTKSYIVATLLQNISASRGHSYVLQCYDDPTITYNSLRLTENMLSSCVMVMQISPEEEQVIAGIILADESDASKFINDTLTEYNSHHDVNYSLQGVPPYPCLSTPLNPATSNFSRCVNIGDLVIYYEMNYKYILLSDRPIPGITAPTMWGRITQFFSNLFSNKKVGNTIQSYNVIDDATNYDRLYIMRNNTLNITAIEEYKYDESNKSMVNILYIRYSGSNDQTNPINRDSLFNRVNDTMRDALQDNVEVMLNYTSNENEQEIILRTQDRSGLWRYMTTILRDRP